MALIAGLDADLRGMPDTGRNLARQYRRHEFIASRLMQNERCSLYKLAAAGQQNNILQKLQRAPAAPVLVVDLAIDVIRVRQVDQLGARLEVAVAPAREPHPGGGAGLCLLHLLQVQQHELPGVQAKALIEQRRVYRAAE